MSPLSWLWGARLEAAPAQCATPAALPALSSDAARPPPHPHSYTHIIVGAGTAGCVLAARLTEQQGSDCRVLLLNPGPRVNDVLSRVPLMSIARSYTPYYAYRIDSVPQKGLSPQRCVSMVAGRCVA